MPEKHWQVSVGGGSNPRWSGDGKELYYYSQDGTIMAAAVESEGETFQIKSTSPLFRVPQVDTLDYDVSADGQRFFICGAARVDQPLSIIVNWQAGLSSGR